MTYEQAKKILHPDTTLEASAEIEHYARFNKQQAKIRAVNEECLVACEALDKVQGRPCIVYGQKDTRRGIFREFCDNNDKCVIEYEDGELHKTYVWRVRFLDKENKGRYFNEVELNIILSALNNYVKINGLPDELKNSANVLREDIKKVSKHIIDYGIHCF